MNQNVKKPSDPLTASTEWAERKFQTSPIKTFQSKNSMMEINGNRLWESLMEMAEIGATEKGGCRRLALTDLDRQGRDLFVSWCREIGCGVEIDEMGNIFARKEGRNPNLPLDGMLFRGLRGSLPDSVKPCFNRKMPWSLWEPSNSSIIQSIPFPVRFSSPST